MAIMVQTKKWILYKHTSDFVMIKEVALDVKNKCIADVSEQAKSAMQQRLELLNLYKARSIKWKPLDAMNHRINTLEYWMFGYEYKKRFIFSPLGNLFIKYINDEEKLAKIFIAMLFSLQFQHPASGTDKSFQLYPFRLIFKLLLDKRLGHKLYNPEFAYILPFVESVDDESYETLVDRILSFRKFNKEELIEIFQQDEHLYVNTIYEWQYYTQRLLQSVGIVDIDDGQDVVKLYHPTKANSKSKPTARTLKSGFIKINEQYESFIERMLQEYSAFNKPIKLDDSERLTIDSIKEIYNFYPKILLDEIGERDEFYSDLLNLAKLIESYSNNENNEKSGLFEDVLEKGFNMFFNVEAKKLGGASRTDIECFYLTKKKKFAVESKSTANKLTLINAGRLRKHREYIGGEYTIVITPRYVPAVKEDIRGTPNVILLASTFSEYLYNHIYHNIREIDFSDFDEVITDNLGKDISAKVSEITLKKFAI
ncbi:hypothetical protein LP090_03885 [Moraxella bovis]|uniref:hypothetical protein n=1 Tax=Moraxella bovis TaxID=476 RepID=UPI0022273593|nr:hypothetical protein [Moraxella bovis]UYZ70232.1 hypothetical protein LP089_08825 [Moraxella bovis]UYZ73859.1 hypothetical protein LP105_03910 [Moraxella bovis]UZA13530.1 hypothetical protein LP102_08880 [Moraxella bovis]UZA43742.1 hypothetical protein LP090_03885 [Moraxella bovis]